MPYTKRYGVSKEQGMNLIVRVQRMFPNCQKYKKCCTKVKGHEILKNGELGKEAVMDLKTKKIKPVDKNPFPDEDVILDPVGDV